ncbi:GAF domain-containing protein [Nordella sp. HKS 07]|uniref:GAF domain-containing protein n=1 Tax=Nordella sp. HKS 07 TaxID=2712222 RepID=UPI0013E14415|nr:GAF domain-containing protein [Nordella sp. HKS 07]QIG51292.1 GAF domain-containing protein [Nordella sp. HKS 07]
MVSKSQSKRGRNPVTQELARLKGEVDLRKRELAEARQQQSATAEVLKAISRSDFDLQTVLDTVVELAARLCGANLGQIFRWDGTLLRWAAGYALSPEFLETQRERTYRLGRDSMVGRTALNRRVTIIDDAWSDPEYGYKENAKIGNIRTMLGVPLLRSGELIGVLALVHLKVEPFTDRQIELVTTFADQAVIAIENARLIDALQARNRDITEALDQQIATGAILRTIAGSPTDVGPVLDAVAESAARLCEARDVVIMLAEESMLIPRAHQGPIPLNFVRRPIGRDWVSGRAICDREPIQVYDILAERVEFPEGYALAERFGWRTILAVPLLREDKAIGVITMRRGEKRPFSQKQIDLLVLFADQAVIAIENAHLFETLQLRNRELTEALDQQTATGTILSAIAASPTDVGPVLKTVAESAARLCEAYDAVIYLADGDELVLRAHHGPLPVEFKNLPIGRELVSGQAVIERVPVHVHDLALEKDQYPASWAIAERLGHRTILAVPLLREDKAIGALVLRRREMRPFGQKQIELLVLFANQAVIAIENSRLFETLQLRNHELSEALEQQMATSTILRAIAASPTDVGPVLNTVTESAARLCEAYDAAILLADGDALVLRAHHGPIPIDFRNWPIARDWATGRAYIDRAPVHVHDLVLEKEEYPAGQAMAERLGHRTILAVPLLREDKAIGVLTLRRREVRPFTQKQIDLLVLFADQAVVAIENSRLFEELQARNRDLTEAIERQTATAEVLKAISRATFDLPTVLRTLVGSAARLCGASFGGIMLREGDMMRGGAIFAGTPEDETDMRSRLVPIDRSRISGRVVLSGHMEHIEDILADPEFDSPFLSRVSNIRALMGVPLLRNGVVEGVFFLGRPEPGKFSHHQSDLVQTFSDQAVIAIENMRLFEELQARTRELQETLDYQTAIGEVLNVISRSPSDVQPVLDVIIRTAVRLCDADGGTIAREKDGRFFRAGQIGFSQEFTELMVREPVELSRGTVTGRTLVEGKVVQILDAATDPEYTWKEALDLAELHTLLGVPLLRDKTVIGTIALIRRTVRPFTEKQIELVTTFADQAVIAIENARLFEEVQARTSDLAHSVEELKALGDVSRSVNSTLDLKTVLQTIVAKAVQLSHTEAGAIYVYSAQADQFRLRATYGMSADLIDAISDQPIRLNDPGIGDAARARQPIQTEDLADHIPTQVHRIVLEAGYRSVLVVPLLRPNKVVGALVVRRRAPGRFSDATVRLMETFAAQSVLAIQNARMYSEIEEKSRQLEIASRHKSQFLANMSHELRTPLNSVLGFTEMLADGLYGELPEKARTTLGRVQANGRHLLGLINDVLDLSKIEAGQLVLTIDNYAIGQIVKTVAATTEPLARAKGLHLSATIADGLPLGRGDERRLAQVLLNLAGNAVKFTENGSVEIAASAQDGCFEVLVRDTGPGIAPEHQARIFEEFQQIDESSTRLKGGTGLGLAISKRIVEMHGGTIGVESTPGTGSTFRVRIPIKADEGLAAA